MNIREIPVRNIYHMLCYAFRTLRQAPYRTAGTERFEHAEDLFAEILQIALSQQIKSGLYREYRDRTESLAGLRGRLLMPGTLQNKAALRQELCCEFDELTEDNLFNRILKAAALTLRQSPLVADSRRRRLGRLCLALEQVSECDPARIDWSALTYHRDNLNYRMLAFLCRLILEKRIYGPDESGEPRESFLSEEKFWWIFQNFLLNWFKFHHPELMPAPEGIAWALDAPAGDALLPAMMTDIVLHLPGGRRMILDAKFYQDVLQERFGKSSWHSAHVYQLFSYVKNMDRRNTGLVSGILVYAQTNEGAQRALYRISGNDIGIVTLDLSRTFPEIHAALEAIPSFFSRACAEGSGHA